MIDFPVILINSLSIIIIGIVIAVAWQRRSNTAATQLITMSVFMLIWAVCSLTEIVSGNANQKIVLRNITQIGAFYTPVACLLFTIVYTGFLNEYKKLIAYGLYGVQSISLLLIFTDHWHHLARKSVQIAKAGDFETVVISSTQLAKVLVSLNFIYIIAALILLIIFLFKTAKGMKRQVISIIAGMSITIIYSIIKVSLGDRFIMLLPISAIFALADFMMLIGIIKYDLLMLSPIGKNAVFDIIDDGIIVSLPNGQIADINKAALNIFNLVKNNRAQHNNLEQIISEAYPNWHNALVNCNAEKFKISMQKDDATHYYRCEIYSIFNKANKLMGSISVLKDYTEQKLKNDLLKFRAERNGLTGIYSRQTFVDKVEAKLQNCDETVCMIYYDIDNFKDINDNYGHICGDYVLKEMCSSTQSLLSEKDIFGRMGGEEFAILMKTQDIDSALKFAEAIRSSVENHKFVFENEIINVTISVGVAFGRCNSFDFLYRIADINLYKAKENGKNRVEFGLV